MSKRDPAKGVPTPTHSLPAWTGGLSVELRDILAAAPGIRIPSSRADLLKWALGDDGADRFEVGYDTPGRGWVHEATAIRCRNGVAVNYPEPYIRRRDPESLVVGDAEPTDKPRFEDRFKKPFASLRSDVFAWLRERELLVMPFSAGGRDLGYGALLVAPANAGFFAAALADLQGLIGRDEVPADFTVRSIIYLAPPFRHTHVGGRQVVVHHRTDSLHEIFSLNLYPGPSAKKGIYGVLLAIGEREGWVTVHGATAQLITPYENRFTITHEGASGAGKSEMLQNIHREPDGRLLLGENLVTGELKYLTMTQACSLRPVTDDMALAHPQYKSEDGKLVVSDAEQAWFVRVNHITQYGVDPHLERQCIHPPEPLIFLNLHGVPDSTCLIWEHSEDAPGKPCPNPRVILPRRDVPDVLDGPVEVDLRTFGIRTPPCTKEHPTYGIVGIFHLLPPALAWLWRLVSPRGHDNPSITSGTGMGSEGVGSYGPFATGRQVVQANLLLNQIEGTPRTRYALIPNQHIGAWRTGFMPQWLAREYLARRGEARFPKGSLRPSPCPLLGYVPASVQIEGVTMPRWFLEVQTQPEVGEAGFAEGARQLQTFFREQLEPYRTDADLLPLGKRVIGCFMDGGAPADYAAILPQG